MSFGIIKTASKCSHLVVAYANLQRTREQRDEARYVRQGSCQLYWTDQIPLILITITIQPASFNLYFVSNVQYPRYPCYTEVQTWNNILVQAYVAVLNNLPTLLHLRSVPEIRAGLCINALASPGLLEPGSRTSWEWPRLHAQQ